MQALHQFCHHIIGSKATTIEEDMARLDSIGEGQEHDERHRLALQFRIGKKQLLKSCLWQYDPQQLVDS